MISAHSSVLISNIAHYSCAARALNTAGYLRLFITGPAPVGKLRRLSGLLPRYWREKFAGRELKGVPESKVRMLIAPELLQKGLRYSRLVSTDRAELIGAVVHDFRAARYIAGCSVLHFSSTVGFRCAKRARSEGTVVICDERRAHPDFEEQILRDELDALGLSRTRYALLNTRAKREYELADYLIVPSDFALASFAGRGFPEDRIFVASYGVATDGVTGREQAPKRLKLLYVGRVVPLKGLHYLIRAFVALGVPDATLCIVGSSDPHYKTVLQSLIPPGVDIRFFSHIPRSRLPDFYRSASALVLPSLSDSFSLVCLEAMSHGVPVIATTNVGAASAIRHGIDGAIVSPADTDALREHMARLHEDRDLVTSMGQSAHARATHYTWARYEAALLSAYREIFARESLTGGL